MATSESQNHSAPVGIMMKYPEPGNVKTRLGREIGMRNAAEFYAVAVAWLLERIRDRSLEFVIFYAPTDAANSLRSLYSFPENIQLVPQQGENLGDRIFHSLRWLDDHGCSAPCVIGTDSPDLPIEWIRQAQSTLSDNSELVIGPARDGGYYLIGCSPVRRDYFEGIDWSTPRVFEQTRERAETIGVSPQLLPEWQDIDTLSDLHQKLR